MDIEEFNKYFDYEMNEKEKEKILNIVKYFNQFEKWNCRLNYNEEFGFMSNTTKLTTGTYFIEKLIYKEGFGYFCFYKIFIDGREDKIDFSMDSYFPTHSEQLVINHIWSEYTEDEIED